MKQTLGKTIKKIAKESLEYLAIAGLAGTFIITYTYSGPTSIREETIKECVVTRSISSEVRDVASLGGGKVQYYITEPSFSFKTPSGKKGKVKHEYLEPGTEVTIISRTTIHGGLPVWLGYSGWPELKGRTQYQTSDYVPELPDTSGISGGWDDPDLFLEDYLLEKRINGGK